MSHEELATVPAAAEPLGVGAPVPAAGGRVRPRVVAVALATGAITASVNLLARPVLAENISNYAVVAPVRDAVWTFSLVGAIATAVAYLAVGLAACLLAPGRGAAWATVGAVLTGLGGIGFAAGFFALGALNWYATSDAIPVEAGTALVAFAGEDSLRVFGPQIVGFLMFVLGLMLLAVALWRARAVPRWLPVAMPVTFLATMIAGSGLAFDVVNAVFMATLVAVAWYLWSSAARTRRVATAR